MNKRRTLRYCLWPPCNNTIREGVYCAFHMKTLKRPYMKENKKAEKYYHNPAWIKFNKHKKKTNPFCEVRGKPPEVIHHKIPKKEGGTLLSNTNTQALCNLHHRMAHAALNQITKGLY